MILTALNAYYDRRCEDPEDRIARFGYSTENISYLLDIDFNGRVVRIIDLRGKGGKLLPQKLIVPQAVKRAGRNWKPNFLWDNISYVLGCDARTETGAEAERENAKARTIAQHSAFKEFHKDALMNSTDPGLMAVRAFVENWEPAAFNDLPLAQEVLHTTGANVIFRLNGELGFIHERRAAKEVWQSLLDADAANSEIRWCLVTGKKRPIQRTHAVIKGVPGGQPGGTNIVSFDKTAFTSYGNKQGENAPVSNAAAFAYTTALNDLLRRDSRHKVQIGDAATVFWAEGAAEAAETIVSLLFGGVEDEDITTAQAKKDEAESGKILDILLKIAQGRPLAEVAPGLDEGTKFFILGLAPNAARLSVRFWYQTSFGELVDRFRQHYRDMELDSAPKPQFPAVYRLLWETAAQGKSENIPPQLAGELMRAILSGGPYPRSLLAALIMRIRADRQLRGLRVSILKACINRNTQDEKEKLSVSLDPENTNPGYRLGRLFAILESIQQAALGKTNVTIRDQYYGSASATPRAVFPVLQRKSIHHLAKLRKEKLGLAIKLDRMIGEIMQGMSDEQMFSSFLSMDDQARFAVGYYHQRNDTWKKAPEAGDDSDTETTTENED